MEGVRRFRDKRTGKIYVKLINALFYEMSLILIDKMAVFSKSFRCGFIDMRTKCSIL